MGKLFDQIFESVISKSEIGGFTNGASVKFKSNYKSAAAYKAMTDELKQQVDDLAKSDRNLIIVQVGDKLSGASAGNQFKTADNMVLTIAADDGGRRTYGRVTVSPEMVDLIPDDGMNLPKVPDSWKRKEKITIKPEPVEDYSKHITRLTDKGDGKNTPANYKLAESTVLKNDNNLLGMLYEATVNPTMVSDSERHAITDRFTQRGLDGNGRFETVGKALNAVTSALDELGFDLDMVSNDIEVSQAHHHQGMKGQRLIAFRRKSPSGDPFEEGPEIENSRISFNFENLGRNGGNDIEVVAYAS